MSKTHRILITREMTEEQRKFAGELGLSVDEIPAISIRYRDNWLSVQDAVRKAGKIALAFTSANGVRGFDRFRQAGLELPDHPRIYAVGGKTAEALLEAGRDKKDIRIPESQDGVGLAQLLADDFLNGEVPADTVVLHFCGNRRRDEFRQYLEESRIQVRDIVVYATELNEMELPGDLSSYGGILFYSPSAVQAFRNSGGFTRNGLPELFAIGSTTAEELSIESGKHVHISPEPDTEVFFRFAARVLEEQDPAIECPPSKGAMGDDKNHSTGEKPDKRKEAEKNLYYNKSLKQLARELRNNSTRSEIRLWTEMLSGKKTGYTFLRQRPVMNYIADFLCKDLKLIIELDGYSHDFEQQWKKDKKRKAELEKAGFKVLRFSDEDVMKDMRNVESELMYWIEKLESKSPPSPAGIPSGEGEAREARGG